jgi:hypothetical protein
VEWKDIEPLSGPEYLSKGCALHLGPVGRGATVQFIETRRLGMWTQGQIRSEAADIHSVDVSAPVAHQSVSVPAAVNARRVRTISASTAPLWFLGCMFMIFAPTLTLVGAIAVLRETEIEALGPYQEGEEFYESVSLDDKIELPEDVLSGLREPFRRFVGRPNAQAAQTMGNPHAELNLQPNNWDHRLFDYVTASIQKHLSSRSFFRRIEVVKDEYRTVLEQMRKAGLPEVFAAIPYTESRYKPEIQSWACAKGYWQFMPEVAYRLEQKNGLDFRVRNCKIRKTDGSTALWTPTTFAPPGGVRLGRAVYAPKGADGTVQCVIPDQGGCAVDDRSDIQKSTKAAVFALKEAWDDPVIKGSGAAVQITISSHNAGYDDGRYGIPKGSNLLPAFRKWSKKNPAELHHTFYGTNIRCPDHKSPKWCGSAIPAETQHYAYNIIAQHFVAVCYYRENYASQYEAFSKWASLGEEGQYCATLRIPSAEAVRTDNWKK